MSTKTFDIPGNIGGIIESKNNNAITHRDSNCGANTLTITHSRLEAALHEIKIELHKTDQLLQILTDYMQESHILLLPHTAHTMQQ